MTQCNQMEQCQEHFTALHAKLDKLDEAIRGNGRPGIQLRLDRLEQDAKRQSKIIWLLIGSLASGAVWLITRWIGGAM
jgi:hypothetical protein